MIKLVIFDADETLWKSHGIWASLLVPPLRKVNDNEIIDSEGKRITLVNGLRQLLKTLKDRGILISLVSLNDNKPNRVAECLELFELYHYFEHPQINWNDKGQNIKKVLKLFEENGNNINCNETLFVDDHMSNIRKAKAACPEIVALHIGSDISKVTEIIKFL